MTVTKTLSTAIVAAALLAQPALARSSADQQIQAGTTAAGKLEQTLDSGKNQDGDKFVVDLSPGWFGDKDLKNAKLEGHLEGVKAAAKFGKKGALDLVFDDLVTASGNTVPVEVKLVSTDAVKAKGHGLRNAAMILGGAVVGHHVAKKMGSKHGALKGAAAATAVVLLMPGGNVVLKRGSELKVKFTQPLDLSSSSSM